MEQRFSLEAAGKLFGVSANAMRARAKKSPEKYRMERDNGGKIWLWIDPESLPSLKARKASDKGSSFDELKASIDALKEQTELRERLAAETARADAAEAMLAREQTALKDALADRDRWHEAYRGATQKGDPILQTAFSVLFGASIATLINGLPLKDPLQWLATFLLGAGLLGMSLAIGDRIRRQNEPKDGGK